MGHTGAVWDLSTDEGGRLLLQALDATDRVVAQTCLTGGRKPGAVSVAPLGSPPGLGQAGGDDAASLDQLLRAVHGTKHDGPKATTGALRLIDPPSGNGKLLKSALLEMLATVAPNVDVKILNPEAVHGQLFGAVDDNSPMLLSAGVPISLEPGTKRFSLTFAPASGATAATDRSAIKSPVRDRSHAAAGGAAGPRIHFSVRNGFLSGCRCDDNALTLHAAVDGRQWEEVGERDCIPSSTADGSRVRHVVLQARDVDDVVRSECHVTVPKFDLAEGGRGVLSLDYLLTSKDNEAQLSLTAPPGRNLTAWVDGVKGGDMGPRGLLRLDPLRGHHIRTEMADGEGRVVLAQQMQVPRLLYPDFKVFMDGNVLKYDAPAGIRVMVAVDGGPERPTDRPITLAADTAHTARVVFYSSELHADGSPPSTVKVFETQASIPPYIDTAELLSVVSLFSEYQPDLPGAANTLSQRLMNKSVQVTSPHLRRLCVVLAHHYHGQGLGGLEVEYLKRVEKELEAVATQGAAFKVHFRLRGDDRNTDAPRPAFSEHNAGRAPFYSSVPGEYPSRPPEKHHQHTTAPQQLAAAHSHSPGGSPVIPVQQPPATAAPLANPASQNPVYSRPTAAAGAVPVAAAPLASAPSARPPHLSA